MKRFFQSIKQFLFRWRVLEDCYYAILPFGTVIEYAKSCRKRRHDFDTLITLTDMNDEVYKKLSYLQFKIDDKHKELRTTIDRAKVCPTAIDKDTVELDASIWMNEQLLELQTHFANYYLDDRLIVTAYYEQRSDMVMYAMQSIENDVQADMQRFLPVNYACTALWLLSICLVLFIILL